MNTIEQLKTMLKGVSIPAKLHNAPVWVCRYEGDWTIMASNFETLHIESIDDANNTLKVWAVHCHLIMKHNLPAEKLLFDEPKPAADAPAQ